MAGAASQISRRSTAKHRRLRHPQPPRYLPAPVPHGFHLPSSSHQTPSADEPAPRHQCKAPTEAPRRLTLPRSALPVPPGLLPAPPRLNAVTRPAAPAVPRHTHSTIPAAPPKPCQHPPILHLISSQQQPPPPTCHTPSLSPNPSPTRDRAPDPSSASPQHPPMIPVENRTWGTSRWGAGEEQGCSAGQKEDEDEDGERRAGHGF